MNNLSQKIKQIIRQMTNGPGVYRMLDAEDKVLYVGKASNLKKRVSSYFNKTQKSVKTRALVEQIKDIEVSVTHSETEALLLESSLIKSLRPKYNILMRDDKSYPYLHLTGHSEYPRLEMMRTKKKPKKGRFFGPYPSVLAVKEALNTLQKVFKIRSCRDSYFNNRTRPCLQYQIKRCTAPCTGYISQEEYQKNVDDAVHFLSGKSEEILKSFEKEMQNAANSLDYEKAAKLRDQIQRIRTAQEQQGMIQQKGEADIIAIEADAGFACIQCVTVREGEVLTNQSFFPVVPKLTLEEPPNDLWLSIFSAFISQYYMVEKERIPALLVTHYPIEEKEHFEEALSRLRGSKCLISTRPRGAKAKWLEFAKNNLKLAVAAQNRSAATLAKRYQELQSLLNLERSIKRMECFDISHTQGQETVASCVVFDSEGPCKAEYRRFNIVGITPGDDYAAMKQALSRRFKRATAEKNMPDILIVDGGKGQVHVAQSVLQDLSVKGVVLLGIAKGPKRKAGFEQLILADQNRERVLSPDSPALHLLQHIRDEAHRFAITFHRKKRQKSGLESSVEAIEGVGSKRRKALLLHFAGIRGLSKAPAHEIAKVPGISRSLADKIYRHFHME